MLYLRYYAGDLVRIYASSDGLSIVNMTAYRLVVGTLTAIGTTVIFFVQGELTVYVN